MRIVVVGGTGLIGSKVVAQLRATGHDAVAASRATGVNSYTGDGLEDALEGSEIVIDVSNSSYTDQAGALDFFYTSTLNLLTFGHAAGVRHHVALSVVGTDRLAQTERGYFFAKDAQETLIRRSSQPFSLVHTTQFFEFIRSIANDATRDDGIRLAHAAVQPIAGDDVATAVVKTALARPTGSVAEFAGPEVFVLSDLVQLELRSRHDPRDVAADPLARYFGNTLTETELLPGPDAFHFATRFVDWLKAGQAENHTSALTVQ